MLDNVPGARGRADRGELAFGTVDTWLLWNLTAGAVHATDASNASRTLLFNLDRMAWDEDLIDAFGIPHPVLPEVRACTSDFGVTSSQLLGAEMPIRGIAGDQQAAAFGQVCFAPGSAKNTYGTGSFLLMNTGGTPMESNHRLLTTVGWRMGGDTTYALEGSVFVTGAAVQWLRDSLGIISHASETAGLAASVSDSGGVYFVPAFAGLGAPHWDPDARAAVVGMTRGTGRAHLARAALEAACFQSRDVLEAMEADCGSPLPDLRVDGGMTANDVLLQLQADILGIPVHRPVVTETTALTRLRLRPTSHAIL
jgi:glycerol kinase